MQNFGIPKKKPLISFNVTKFTNETIKIITLSIQYWTYRSNFDIKNNK